MYSGRTEGLQQCKTKGKLCVRKCNQIGQLNIKYNFHIVKLIDHLNSIASKLDYHAGGKWLIHGTKHRKENQLQCLKHPCKLSLGENIYQTKWKSISSSIGSIIYIISYIHYYSSLQIRGQKTSQGGVSTVKTAIYKVYISYASF